MQLGSARAERGPHPALRRARRNPHSRHGSLSLSVTFGSASGWPAVMSCVSTLSSAPREMQEKNVATPKASREREGEGVWLRTPGVFFGCRVPDASAVSC